MAPTRASPWCWLGWRGRPPCSTCAATGTMSAWWPAISASAARPPQTRAAWTCRQPGSGSTGFSLPLAALTATGRRWPAPWPCAGAWPSSPAAPGRARPTPPPACWPCCLPRRPTPGSCAWPWPHPRARRRRGSSRPSTAPWATCRPSWATPWTWTRWCSAWGARAPCMPCWARTPAPGISATMRAGRWMWMCSSWTRPPWCTWR